MSRIPGAGIGQQETASVNSQSNDLRDVELDDFLQLLITELQNQDPLDPTDNSEVLQQISQIREIGATDRLSETLDSVLLGQNMSTASSLIGKRIEALSDSVQEVSGIVDRVTVDIDENDPSSRTLRVHVGGDSVRLTNIRQVLEG